MPIVAGVDFGTQSVRVSIVDSQQGRLGSAVAEYPVCRSERDPDLATQRHQDHMNALGEAMRGALQDAGVKGDRVEAVALDTTGSTVVAVDERLQPLDDYYLWCDHRAHREAREITEAAHQFGLEAIHWYGGAYSSEWGFAKLLHWLRHHTDRKANFYTALEHCDMAVATLCQTVDLDDVPRSICAMGHKWMWNKQLGGLPPESFLTRVDPLFRGIHSRLRGRYSRSDKVAGTLSAQWAHQLGLEAGIPIPFGAIDAHWDAIGSGIREGDVVNVVGTSTCIMAIASQVDRIPGVCGVVQGSIHPDYYGIEAGLSATGDIFDAIARRAGTTVAKLSSSLKGYRAGQTGLLRLTWDNGDRTVLVNPNLGGMTLGWNLNTTVADELFAAIEGTALHTRIILDRMSEYGVSIARVINGGGIPQKNEVLNQVYANVLQKPVLVPRAEVTSLGSSIFAFLAAGAFESIDAAQEKLCPGYRVVEPEPVTAPFYEDLYSLFRRIYFAMGDERAETAALGDVLGRLREIRQKSQSLS